MQKLQKYLKFKDNSLWPFQSSNPQKTFKQYLSDLKHHRFHNKEVQELYDKLGPPIMVSYPDQ